MTQRSAAMSRVRDPFAGHRTRIGGVKAGVRLLVVLVSICCGPTQAEAQQNPQPPVQTFTLGQALQYALEHYPTVRAALEQVTVASANVDVAEGGYLPRLEG